MGFGSWGIRPLWTWNVVCPVFSLVADWVANQFSGAELGDKRRTKRLMKVAHALTLAPGASLAQALPKWPDLKGAYRLFDTPEVTHEAILSPHCHNTRHLINTQPGHYLLIQDWTQLDFTNRDAENLGQIGNENGRGILAHTTLAVRLDTDPASLETPVRAAPLGILSQVLWTRPPKPKAKKEESWRQRLKRPRESEYWGQALQDLAPPAPGIRRTYVADRESDLSGFWDGSRLAKDTDFNIRIFRQRRLENQRLLSEELEAAEVLGGMWVDVRGRTGQQARRARLEIRSTQVSLKGSRGPVWVVEAREIAPPPKAQAIHWKLVTSWPAGTLAEAVAVIRTYTLRWIIEELHKAWKSGAGVERARLRDGERLAPLAGVLVLVALRLLMGKIEGEEGVIVPEWEEPELETVLERHFGRPKAGWTQREKVRAIARLGGFLARKGDGEPGWQTIWRGWMRLMDMLTGFEIAQFPRSG
ncbi:MAG TPA: IS4 family transposase [Isosphaeraceae bacterium]|nr:IS4 family transposase [Isosphaeraceae bacterium]